MVMLLSLDSWVKEVMRSKYICFCGPLPVMMATMGGRTLLAVDVELEYLHRASRRREKSSSGVQDVLLTSSLVFPAIISSQCLLVSGKRSRNSRRESGFEMGWKIAAGRSWRVNIGERML